LLSLFLSLFSSSSPRKKALLSQSTSLFSLPPYGPWRSLSLRVRSAFTPPRLRDVVQRPAASPWREGSGAKGAGRPSRGGLREHGFPNFFRGVSSEEKANQLERERERERERESAAASRLDASFSCCCCSPPPLFPRLFPLSTTSRQHTGPARARRQGGQGGGQGRRDVDGAAGEFEEFFFFCSSLVGMRAKREQQRKRP